MIDIYELCIYSASFLPILSTIAYLLTKFNDIIYAYSLFLGAAGPIIWGLKLAETPDSVLAPFFTPIAIIFIIYAVVAITLGIICFSHCKKEKKIKSKVKAESQLH